MYATVKKWTNVCLCTSQHPLLCNLHILDNHFLQQTKLELSLTVVTGNIIRQTINMHLEDLKTEEGVETQFSLLILIYKNFIKG